MTRGKAIKCLLVYSLAMAVVVGIAVGLSASRGSRAFKRYVCRPIPNSVDEIRADLRRNRRGRDYVLRFKISAGDIAKILKSKPFEEFESVSFNGYSLIWEGPKSPSYETSRFGHSQDIALYWTKTPPEWFRLDDWGQPEVYMFREYWGMHKRYHVQVVIYNKQIGEAYFVDHVDGGDNPSADPNFRYYQPSRTGSPSAH